MTASGRAFRKTKFQTDLSTFRMSYSRKTWFFEVFAPFDQTRFLMGIEWKYWNSSIKSRYRHFLQSSICLVVTQVSSYQIWEGSEQYKVCARYTTQSSWVGTAYAECRLIVFFIFDHCFIAYKKWSNATENENLYPTCLMGFPRRGFVTNRLGYLH